MEEIHITVEIDAKILRIRDKHFAKRTLNNFLRTWRELFNSLSDWNVVNVKVDGEEVQSLEKE